jgi:hypothetical protein
MKNLNLLIAFILLPTLVFCQQSRLEFGIESGVNVSKVRKYEWLITDVPLEKPTWMSGFQVALSLKYRISEHWRLKIALEGDKKGWKGQRGAPTWFCATGQTPESLARMAEQYRQNLLVIQENPLFYNTVPFLAEYSFWHQRLYAEVGGYWARPVFKEEYVPNDFGGSIGMGAKLKLFKWLRLNLETRYSQGFSNIFRETAILSEPNYTYSYPVNEKAKGNQTLAVNMGLFFSWH